ncbi:AraC family transcriptional regulator [Marinobacter sp. SS21]|uniref:AraC family transcriptional regulator n=1 Tax=Marinobacter sp. SS21 TaxID=2979460 RepID=UPI00232BB6BB|nr:AraC family transcriptional regulator [Marinobacter sp. SS21]MDC0661917.1 AraC family transcriptional regulator [Marinobacter sp. SS21]
MAALGSPLRTSTLLGGLAFWLLHPLSGLATESLDHRLDRLKGEVAALSQELFELEDAILHPADTRVSIFLSVSRGDAIALDSIELKIDGEPVASHLYTDREYAALNEGGLQRLYVGNVPLGQHQITATMTARTENNRYLRRETQLRFHKRRGDSRVRLLLEAPAPDYEPVLLIQEGR